MTETEKKKILLSIHLATAQLTNGVKMSDEPLQKMECFVCTSASLCLSVTLFYGLVFYVMHLSAVNFIKHLGQGYPISG